jgi:hypothetical protein
MKRNTYSSKNKMNNYSYRNRLYFLQKKKKKKKKKLIILYFLFFFKKKKNTNPYIEVVCQPHKEPWVVAATLGSLVGGQPPLLFFFKKKK